MKNNDKEILLKGLSKFVDERNIKKVRMIFDEFHPLDIYKTIKDWPVEKAILLLRLLTQEDASDLFSEMTADQQEDVIQSLKSEEIAEIFSEMYTDEAIDILEELPAKITRKVLKAADTETRSKINTILRYDKNQIGYHMVVDYIAIAEKITIKEAKKSISQQVKNEDLEIVGSIFVYNDTNGEFVGIIKPEDIIAHDNNEKINNYIEYIKPVKTTDHMSMAEDSIDKYDLPSIPVVNTRNKLVGVIEADDIIERYEDAEEAAYEQAAIKVIDKPYLEITIWEMFKSRVPWIVALLIVGTLTQVIILGFQQIWISDGLMADPSNPNIDIVGSSLAILAVASAMSLSSSINDAAGNAGSQTSSTLVRAIALGEVRKGNYGTAIKKEFFVACAIGFTIMITAFIRINLVWAAFGEFGGYGNGYANIEYVKWMMLIAFIASISFLITIVLGNLVGAILPIVADKYGIDGAIFSGPVQTTIVDIMTITIYFSLTTVTFVLLNDSLSGIEQFA